jgi:RND superfamily putative drug exporter
MTNADSSPGFYARFVSGRKTKWAVLGLWLVLVMTLGSFAGKINDVQKNDISAWLPKSADSTKEIVQEQKFQPPIAPALVVFQHNGGITDADKQKIDALKAELVNPANKTAKADPARVRFDTVVAEGVVLTPAPNSPDAVMLYVPIDPGTGGWNKMGDVVKGIRDVVGTPADGLTMHVTGPAGGAADSMESFKKVDGALTFITLGVVFVILLLAYRSPFLWLMPLLSVFMGLGGAEGAVYLLAKHAGLTVNGWSAFVLPVLAIGAGIDYAMLLIARYREELRNYQDRHEAMAHAVHRAGPAILASSATVAVSMLCLLLAEMNSTKGLGPVSAVAIGFSLLAETFFLPAFLVILGRWVFWPIKPIHGSVEPTTAGVWSRVGRKIAKRPRMVWVVTSLILAALGLGMTSLKLHPLNGAESFTNKPDSVVGAEVQAKYFPAGYGQPIYITMKQDQREAVTAAIKALPGVDPASVAPPQGLPEFKDGVGLIQATSTAAADSAGGRDTALAVRTAAHNVPGADAHVGGMAAMMADSSSAATRDDKVLIPVILFVVLLILGLLLRAILAPILLIITVVLSFAASLGISALIFHGPLGFGGEDNSFPLIVFVFLVALGVDYNIFLMTRIREESLRGGTRRGALIGLSATGGVITWAGLVLASTFGVLGTLSITFAAELGFAVALGVLLDTLIVRSVLVTALTLDIGQKMWWPSKLASADEPGGGTLESVRTEDSAALV